MVAMPHNYNSMLFFKKYKIKLKRRVWLTTALVAGTVRAQLKGRTLAGPRTAARAVSA